MLLASPMARSRLESATGHSHGGDHGDRRGPCRLLLSLTNLPAWVFTLVHHFARLRGIHHNRRVFHPAVFVYITPPKLREMYTALALTYCCRAFPFTMMAGGPIACSGHSFARCGGLDQGSEFRHELETDLEPFKGLLLGLFFITVVRASIRASGLRSVIIIGMAPAGFILVQRPGSCSVSAVLFKTARARQWLFALGLAPRGQVNSVFVLVSCLRVHRPAYAGTNVPKRCCW